MILDKKTHTYEHEGKQYHSVSSVVDCICGVDDNKYTSQNIQMAMTKGTLIHSEVENYIKNGASGFTDEFYAFEEWILNEKPVILASELIVWSDEYGVAGSIDIVTDKGIIDIKTGSSVLLKRWNWQLALYLFLLTKNEDDYNRMFRKVLQLRDNKYAFISVVKHSYQEVVKALEDFKNNVSNNKAVDTLDCLPTETARQLSELLQHKDNIEAEIKKIREVIAEEMVNRNILKMESDILSITLIDSVVTNKLDTTALKKAEPLIYEKYLKETISKAYVKIKIKEV